MSWLRKIFQPKTAAAFENNKYNIDSKEYKQLKADLKKANVEFGHKEKVAFKEAVRTGNLSSYMDAKEIDAKFSETMGLSLSTKIGKADPTKDIEEAKSLAKAGELDCDLDKVLKHIEKAKAGYVQFEKANLENSEFMNKALSVNNNESAMKRAMKNSGFMEALDELFS